MNTQSVSLTLGGGAARGFSHIGVLKALDEKRIKVRDITGTSMGALIWSLYALGWSPEDMVQLAKTTSIMSLVDLSVMRLSLHGEKLTHWLQRTTKRQQFSDTHIPLTIIATDFKTNTQHAFKEGSIASALRASVSVPALQPAIIGGKVYVDGGVVANLPLDHALGNVIIASSCYGWTSLGRHARRERLTAPQLSAACIHAMMQQQENQAIEIAGMRGKIIHLIRPNVSEIQPWKFSDIDATIEAGYREAQEVLKGF